MHMKEENTQNKVQRKYNDAANRHGKVNQTAMISLTFIELLLILALVIQTFAVKTNFGKLGIFPLIVLIIGAVVNWVVYLKNKKIINLFYLLAAMFFIWHSWISDSRTTIFIFPLVAMVQICLFILLEKEKI